MTENDRSRVPVWTLTTTGGSRVPAVLDEDESMTPQRLSELRTALAAFADSPVVTLEAHPMPKQFDRSSGIPLDAMSPLAQHLAQLVSQTAKSEPAAAQIAATGEVVYRMVVPAKFAAQVGKGLVRPMAAKGVPGGIRGALVGGSGIVGGAAFVPVAAGEAAAAGAAGGAAGSAGVAAATGTALTVAAPLVLLAIAVGVSAYADNQRQQAIDRVTELLQKLHADKLDAERSELEACRDAIDKATAVLLDQGKIGAALGLDSAVHAIGKATGLARHRLNAWQVSLDALPDGPVGLTRLAEAIPGVHEAGGEFQAHLELAALAIALKRRVIVLQAVEQSQSDATKPFQNFVRSLKDDQKRVDNLEADIASTLLRLSSLELHVTNRLSGTMMTRSQVDHLLQASYRLRDLGAAAASLGQTSDMVIDIAKNADGSILVLPAAAAA